MGGVHQTQDDEADKNIDMIKQQDLGLKGALYF